MKKERIEFPQHVIWTGTKTIQKEDINFANHMGNERILVWADDIRAQALAAIGWTSEQMIQSHGIIVANHTVVYHSEGFLDDEIQIEVGIDHLTECSFDMVIRLQKKGAERYFISLRTGIICFDYAERKIAEIPSEFHQKLQTSS